MCWAQIGAAGLLYGASQVQGQHNADVARSNATAAKWQAEDARARGEIEEAAVRRNVEQVKGSQRASLAASGVDVNRGSALDILSDTAAFGELDALAVRANAEREAYGYQTQANSFEAAEDAYQIQSYTSGAGGAASLLTNSRSWGGGGTPSAGTGTRRPFSSTVQRYTP